jgi:hypothetical protein
VRHHQHGQGGKTTHALSKRTTKSGAKAFADGPTAPRFFAHRSVSKLTSVAAPLATAVARRPFVWEKELFSKFA